MRTNRPTRNFTPLLLAVFLPVLLILLCASGYTAKQQHAQPAYATYVNARYGFSVRYPRSLKMEPPPEIGDGRSFDARDGFKMDVWGSNIDVDFHNDTLKGNLTQARHEDFTHVTYQATGRNWYVLSGTKGDKIVYEKTYLGKGSLNTLSISYPVKLKAKYNKIVTTISASFKPGNLAEGG